MKHAIILFVVFNLVSNLKGQTIKGALPIVVKDFGVVELKKGDVIIIFYITVTNTGHEPVHLFVNATKCCQNITKEDIDCDSIKLTGGDMGELFPNDSRNLTLLYGNLYPYNRVGSCDISISDTSGGSLEQSVTFSTTLVNDRVPRLLEQYYKPTDVMSCESIDEDPLDNCNPFMCDIRYDGTRSLYNHTTKRCEKVAQCESTLEKSDYLVAYDVNTGTCKILISQMNENEFSQFKDGKPSAHTLSHEHGYPINVRCNKGKPDDKGHFCECNKGWSSAPFNHKFFNPDIQVYHMCNVWLGSMSHEQAKNITVKPKPRHETTNTVVFSVLGTLFLLLLSIFGYLYYKMRLKEKSRKADVLDQAEMGRMTRHVDESD